MTKLQFRYRFDLALTQYRTIDAPKCERIGAMLQGFVGIKNGKDAFLVPFQSTMLQTDHLVDEIWTRAKDLILKSDFVGVSFVQHYIHYT